MPFRRTCSYQSCVLFSTPVGQTVTTWGRTQLIRLRAIRLASSGAGADHDAVILYLAKELVLIVLRGLCSQAFSKAGQHPLVETTARNRGQADGYVVACLAFITARSSAVTLPTAPRDVCQQGLAALKATADHDEQYSYPRLGIVHRPCCGAREPRHPARLASTL